MRPTGLRFCPSRIFSIAQKRRQISTRNFQYLIQHQLASFINLKKGRILRRSWCFCDVMFYDFCFKSDKYSRVVKMNRFTVKHKQNSKRCKTGRSVSRISFFLFQSSKFKMSIKKIKIQNSVFIQKDTCYEDNMPTRRVGKFTSISLFWQCNGRRTGAQSWWHRFSTSNLRHF